MGYRSPSFAAIFEAAFHIAQPSDPAGNGVQLLEPVSQAVRLEFRIPEDLNVLIG